MITPQTPSTIEGAWQIARYVVNGEATEVDGVLLLVDGRWSTLYFVAGSEGPWGSAEAGTYEFGAETLSFRHRLMFQGGGGRPLHVTQSASHVEACPITLIGDALTIQFPSGSVLVCHRLPGVQS
jgi:hypothetical protein